MRPFLLFFMPFLAALPALGARDCVVRSGPQTAALVELYTSEGCSSCPPADRWLSSFVNPLAAQRVVPIAFHIDYWDDLGWKDAFADERYTERQRAFAKASGAGYVYTPQVVIGGRDDRDWRREGETAEAIARINATAARAEIELRPRATAQGGIAVEASARIPSGTRAADLALFVVATQDGLSSRVTAGENNGEHLRHSFVVRAMAVARPAAGASLHAAATFAAKPDWNLDKMGVAAFVQNLKTGEVLQAVSAPVCRS